MDDASGSQTRSAGAFPRYLSSLLEVGTTTGLSDGQLLDLFLARRGASAEVAFAAILERHGGMVRRVCREVLEDSHDADDAFQATFLILARSAGGIRIRRSLGPWLHGVALRVARRSRADAARRRRHERRRGEMTQPSATPDGSSPVDPEVGRALHEEIGRLGEKLRSPVVLCYLEGLTHEMAAEQIGCPVGTVRSRLASARDRLKGRLMRRGIAPSLLPASLAKLGDVAITSAPTVPISSSLAETTLRAALRIGAGDPALAGIVSAPVLALVEEGLRAMFWTKVKLLAITTLSMGVITTGAGVAAYSYRFADGAQQERTAEIVPPVSKKAATASSPAKKIGESKKTLGRFGIPLGAEEQQIREALERSRALIKEFDSQSEIQKKSFLTAKTQEERDNLSERLRRDASRLTVPMVAGALFDIAERWPGTTAAEESLIWIVSNDAMGGTAESAAEMLARDHAASAKLRPLLDRRPSVSTRWGSRAVENLLREIVAKNPDARIRGLTTYNLGMFLSEQAWYSRTYRLFTPEQSRRMTFPFFARSWGSDYLERIKARDPQALEREAEGLLEQVTRNQEYAQLPATPSSLEWVLPLHPATIGESAEAHLDGLRRLGIGKAAPEIAGVDLDGKPMKLSDYRGKVVVLYFCPLAQLRPSGPGADFSQSIQEEVRQADGKPLIALGIPVSESVPVGPEARSMERIGPRLLEFKAVVRDAKVPIRFWWDADRDGKPGPIRSDWRTDQFDLILIDHHGLIRYKRLNHHDLVRNAIGKLLAEREKDQGR